ncbi:MAG: cytochrome c1 [Alphaproteobacteria bacterium]|jgi:ubiquinol-cytochrome c reductase cytochrome c1 subunit|nr:cytochrome c1 [Alphaproteobacteria bacterium]
MYKFAKVLAFTAVTALFASPLYHASPALAAGSAEPIMKVDWSHSGPFGTFDRASLQRGLQVYREVCSGCHGLRFIAFRNLLEIGLTEKEAKTIAAEYTVMGGPNDEGEMYERPGKLFDYMPSPFDNEKAARASNNGAFPPDLSLIAKARIGGENYLYSLLLGYEEEPPEGVTLAEGMAYNRYFPGHQIAMGPPIDDEAVEYADGTAPTKEQIARDVSAFLMWTAEPAMEARKRMGVKVVLFLIVLTLVLYGVKRKVWADLH